MVIELPTGYYRTNDKIYKASSVDLQTGLSVLVGCNGTGKTTFLKILTSECKEKGIPIFSYDNLFDGGNNAKSAMLMADNFLGLARNIVSSEGENILNNISNAAKKIGAFVKDGRSKSNKIVIMFDAIDSGLSIDGIVEIKNFLKFIISHEKGGDFELYVIVSANSYEMANGEKCVDLINGRYVTFNSYDEYREFVLGSREYKDKRYARAAEKG